MDINTALGIADETNMDIKDEFTAVCTLYT